MLPLEAEQVWLAALLYDPEIVEVAVVGNAPGNVDDSVAGSVRDGHGVAGAAVGVVALTESELPLMHMLVGMGNAAVVRG